MKKFSFLFFILLISIMAFADTAVLIDFSKLAADYPDANPKENKATLIDFSDKAGTGFTEEEKKEMKTSLALNNWEVILSSSSRTVKNQTLSSTREVGVKETATKYAKEKVMGIRVHFPVESYNSWAIIQPPFDIPAYMRKAEVQADGTLKEDVNDKWGQKFENGLGVVKNVGVLKSVSINVLGLNFPHCLELIISDQNEEEMSIFMGYLDFDGWKTLTWNNPNYINEVRNRELRKFPLYPKSAPMVKIVGIKITRDSSIEGGDFVGYIKDVTVTYDKAVLTLERDIDDEAVWGILDEREKARRNAEFTKLGNMQVMRYLEKKKMHIDGEAPASTTKPTP